MTTPPTPEQTQQALQKIDEVCHSLAATVAKDLVTRIMAAVQAADQNGTVADYFRRIELVCQERNTAGVTSYVLNLEPRPGVLLSPETHADIAALCQTRKLDDEQTNRLRRFSLEGETAHEC